MEYTFTEACNKEYYFLLETPKKKSDVGLGINDVNFERTNFFLKANEILIERMKLETQTK